MNRNRMRANTFGRGMGAVGAALGIRDANPLDPFWTIPIHGLYEHDGGTGSGGGAGGTGGTGSGGADKDKSGAGGGGTGSDADKDKGAGGTKTVADMTAEEKAEHYRKLAEGALSPEEVKRLQDSAAELEKIRDSQRSDTEKLEKRATTAEARVAELEPLALRLEVALDKGLSRTTAMRLTGKTKSELEADADAFIKEYGTPAQRAEKETKDKQTDARRKQDGGVRGTGNEGKASVSSGAELYASRRGKSKTAA